MQKVLQSSLPDISGCSFGCNVFERRGVIERLEARSEVQLNSERIAVEAGPEADLVFNIPPLSWRPPGLQKRFSDKLHFRLVNFAVFKDGNRTGSTKVDISPPH